MLMTIDVGNTNVLFGVFNGEELVANFRINSRTERTADELAILVMDLCESQGVLRDDISDVIVSCVVPKIMDSLEELFDKYYKIKPLIVGPGTKTGISIRADNPKEVGADRIVNVVAARTLYERSCIVIDFGTATTFDYVSEDWVFQYTVIMPGLEISARALSGNTAKLPQVEITKPESVLASNTVSGMQVGIVYGYIGAVEYTITQMIKELGEKPYVVATGGLGRLIYESSELIDIYNPNIAFEGMKQIYKRTKRIANLEPHA